MKMFTVCLLVFLFSFANCKQPEVITSVGLVAGHLKTSFGGKPFSAFEGIPYAKPPIGDLRFQVPEPADPWTGTWNATTLHECIQLTMSGQLIGQEDCLYINVYVPREQPLKMEDIDVIVHIHGGGFKFGSGNSYTLPDYLMDKNAIFVTFNYRLDALGFLSTGDQVLPGNLGLKDQILALKWVQDNIKCFGGNPNSVTITGFSAGSASTHLLYLSPLTEELFQRGVSHSGTALNLWAIQDKDTAKLKAQQLAETLGCKPENSKELVSCLKERPASTILEKASKLSNNAFTLTFLPVVDKDVLPKHPLDILQEDKVKNIPWIFSTTSQDGLFPGFMIANLLPQILENWNHWAPILLRMDKSSPESEWEKISEAAKNLYTDGTQNLGYKELIRALTDRFFTIDAEKAAKLQTKASSSPVYYYWYNFYGGSTFSDLMEPNLKPEFKGIGHGDDIIHLYGNVVPNAVINDEDKEMINIMTDILRSFARFGTPKLKDVDWKATGSEELTYLNISGPKQITVETKKQIGEVEFWDKHTTNKVQKDEL